jgi:hypothetical protein
MLKYVVHCTVLPEKTDAIFGIALCCPTSETTETEDGRSIKKIDSVMYS